MYCKTRRRLAYLGNSNVSAWNIRVLDELQSPAEPVGIGRVKGWRVSALPGFAELRVMFHDSRSEE